MKVGENWLFIYDTHSEKPSKVVGRITEIQENLIEIDSKYLVNKQKILRAERQDGEFDD